MILAQVSRACLRGSLEMVRYLLNCSCMSIQHLQVAAVVSVNAVLQLQAFCSVWWKQGNWKTSRSWQAKEAGGKRDWLSPGCPWVTVGVDAHACCRKKPCLSFFSLSQLKMLAAEGCHRHFLVTQFGTTLTEVSLLSDLQVPWVHPSIPAGCFQPLWGAHSPPVSEVWCGCGARGLLYFAPVCTPQVPADTTLAPCWLCTDIFSS